jgi:hypothetical protein
MFWSFVALELWSLKLKAIGVLFRSDVAKRRYIGLGKYLGLPCLTIRQADAALLTNAASMAYPLCI